MYRIRNYRPSDEKEWKQCHLTSYYHSIYFDELIQFKPRYETPTIELVAVTNRKIIGILDVQIEIEPKHLCWDDNNRSGLVSIIGVCPKYRRKGIGSNIIKESIEIMKKNFSIRRLEIWVRDDYEMSKWLQKNNFTVFYFYYQVSLDIDFFEKFDINFPFEIYPAKFEGNVSEKMFKRLLKVHAPERSFKIIGLEKFF